MVGIKTKIVLPLFSLIYKLFSEKGFGRFSLIQSIYKFSYSWFMPKGTTLMEVEGIKINLPTHSSLTSHLIMYGNWEKFQTKLFEEFIHKGMVVVDIGANIGWYTLLAAKYVGRKGKVFAFEPEPANHTLLIKNIEANGYKNVISIRKAVSNSIGTITLFLNRQDSAEHSIFAQRGSQEGIVVDSVTLDDFLREEPIIDVIKMDIEGAEMLALLGMDKIINRSPNLVMFTEFTPNSLEKAGFSPVGFFDRLCKHSFRIYMIDEAKQQLEATPTIAYLMGRLKAKGTNLLCVKGNLRTGRFL